jgi:catechol 2,3-dioxygenase-like lactoylglutathione lyase family enzyme
MIGQNSIHANFSVANIETAKEFYCEKLGFKLAKELEGQILLQAGGNTKILIYEKADHQPWNATILGIEVDDVRKAVGQLKDAGITVEKIKGTDEAGILNEPEVGEAAWFKDPAGNWICINNMIS